MKYWLYTSTNDQGLHVGSVIKNEEEPIFELENVEFMEISEKDYNDCLSTTPEYVIADIFGEIVYEGSYMMCDCYKDKCNDVRTYGSEIVLRKTHVLKLIDAAKKSIWWNTIQRFIEIEGGKINRDSIKFVGDVVKKHLLPNTCSDLPERELKKFYKTGFMTFDERLGAKKVTEDLGEFIRFRLTFGDKPINRDAILEINIKLLRL